MPFGFVFRKHWRARAADRRERALKGLSTPELLRLLAPPPRSRPKLVTTKAEPAPAPPPIVVNVMPARHKTVKMHRSQNGDLVAEITEH